MAWFRNRYTCPRCGREWTGEWSCMADDDCKKCGARHIAPDDSDELTHVIEERDGAFCVMESPVAAESSPDYREIGRFETLELAEDYVTEVM